MLRMFNLRNAQLSIFITPTRKEILGDQKAEKVVGYSGW